MHQETWEMSDVYAPEDPEGNLINLLSTEILEEITKLSDDLQTAGIMNLVLALRKHKTPRQEGCIRNFVSAVPMILQLLIEGNRFDTSTVYV